MASSIVTGSIMNYFYDKRANSNEKDAMNIFQSKFHLVQCSNLLPHTLDQQPQTTKADDDASVENPPRDWQELSDAMDTLAD